MMSDQLTVFERALLSQLEVLAKGSEASLTASSTTSAQLQDLSRLLTSKITKLEHRVTTLEQREKNMIELLNNHMELTEDFRTQCERLVQQVNALLEEQQK